MGELEEKAVLLTFTAQCASLLHDAISRQQVNHDPDQWVHRTIQLVKVLAAVSNLTILLRGPLFVVDSFLYRPNSMYRWAEWTVLAFTMTFVVESIDATNLKTPLKTAASQSISTLCGSLLPLITNGVMWLATFVCCIALYSYLFVRFSAKNARVKRMREELPPHSYALHRAQLAQKLMRSAC